MPEIKNTFLAGKMNKSLDDRLLPEGEYRDALNIQVTKSEGSDVGVVQNIKGNTLIGDVDLPEGYEVIGSCFDDQENAIYWFVTNNDSSYVYRYGPPASTSPLPTGTTTTTTTTTTSTTTIAPTLSVSVSGQTSPQENTQYTYTANVGGTATGTVAYSWSVVNGTIVGSSTDSTVTILWDEVTTDTAGSVSVSITRAGLNANDTLNTTIVDVPVSFGIQITENGSTTLTDPIPQNAVITYETSLSGTATGTVTYNWTVAGGTFIGQGTNSVTVTWGTSGAGSIRVDATRESINAFDENSITVTPGAATIDVYARTPLEPTGMTIQYSVNGGAYQNDGSGAVTSSCGLLGTISGIVDGDSVVVRIVGTTTGANYPINGIKSTTCPTSITGASATYNYGTVSIGTNNLAIIIDNTPTPYSQQLGYNATFTENAYYACSDYANNIFTTVYTDGNNLLNTTKIYSSAEATSYSTDGGWYSDGVNAIYWDTATNSVNGEVACSGQTTTTTTTDPSQALDLGYEASTGTGWTLSSGACSEDISNVAVYYYHISNSDSVALGTIVYTDNYLTTIFDGGFKWYQLYIGTSPSQVIQIDDTGEIIGISNCS